MDVRFTPTGLRFAHSLCDARRHVLRRTVGSRRGVALMVVLGLLSMFVLVAMAFVMTASSHRESAQNASRQELYGDPPDAILNRAMYQIVRGSNNPFSRIGPHSLLEDMYGDRETIIGAVIAQAGAYAPQESFPRPSGYAPVARPNGFISNFETEQQRFVRGQFVDLKIVSFGPNKKPGVANFDDDGNGIADDLADIPQNGQLLDDDRFLGDPKGQTQLDNVEGFYAGRLLTFLDGPAKNETVRIVRYYDAAQEGRSTVDLTQPPDFRLLVTRPQNGQPIIRNSNDAVRVVINGRPFNGAGFGFMPNNNGLMSLNVASLPKRPSDAIVTGNLPYSPATNSYTWPIAFTPNPSEPEYQAYLDEGRTGIDGMPWNPLGVDADEDYDAPDYQNMMLAGAIWSREQGLRSRWVVRVPSLHRPDLVAFHLQGISLANNSNRLPDWLDRHNPSWATVLTGGNPTVQDGHKTGRFRQKIILRPDPQDHMADASNPWRPGDVEWSGNPFFHPVMGPWDVDNDGDGINDSIWVDLGSSVQTAENGKRYKSLFAILCLDLDGRFNVNVHGNWTHYTARSHLQPETEEGYEYGQFDYNGNNGSSIAPSYDLSNDSLQREAWAMDYYILGMRTVGRKYPRTPPPQSLPAPQVVRDNNLPTRLFYWGSDTESVPTEGGPYAGSAGTYVRASSSAFDPRQFNAHYTGGSGADKAYWGSTTSWTQSGQGFSVAEVNLGGVLPLGLMTYPYNPPPDPNKLPPPPSKPVNPYRILLEGHPLRTDSGTEFITRNGEGRYGERATFFAQAGSSLADPFSNPYLGIYNDVSAYFARMLNDPSSVPGFARPGMTFVDDNSPLPPSMGTGYYTYLNYLSWPSIPITKTGSLPPSIGAKGSGAGQFWFAPQMHSRVMANHSEYAQLTTRGNRFTDASYTFWGRDNNGNGDQLAIKGVGNYGFHVDPNGHIGLALDFRGIPYANHRALSIPRAEKPPSYIGDSLTIPSGGGKTANLWVNPGETVNYAWRRGHKWLHVNESIDDPWEMDVYTVPRETRAYTLNGSGEVPIDPLSRGAQWSVATAATRRYPRTGTDGMKVPGDAETVPGPPDTFPNPTDVARSATYFVDRPYSLSDLEPMIRFGDVDVTETDSRICGILGRSGILYNTDQLDSIRRWLLTTDSWDVPSPNISAPPELAYALEALPKFSPKLAVNSTNLTFSDLVLAKILAAKVYANSTNPYYPQPTDYANYSFPMGDSFDQSVVLPAKYATRFGPNQLVPRDLLLGTRMDINRPFGNAMDDDFDGTVDEPPPPGPNLLHRAGPLNPNGSNDLQKGFALSTGHFQASPGNYTSGELNIMYTDIGNTNQRANSSLDQSGIKVSEAEITGVGVAPEASNWQSNPYIKRRLANYDASNRVWIPDPMAAEMSRQDLAKHLYILAMLFNEVSWQFPFGGAPTSGGTAGNPAEMAGQQGAGDTVLSPSGSGSGGGSGSNPDASLLRKMAAYRCAQWAVNVVDFRDRDAIMTPFEFDIFPFVDNDGDGSTWDVNGLLEKSLDNSADEDKAFPPGLLPNGSSSNNSFENSTVRKDNRGLVWGMEAPELLLTETLAFHDLRVADADKDTGPNKKTPDDKTFDQVRVPQGSLFVELYAAGARQAQPNPYHPDLAHFPPELYDIISNDPLRPEHVPPGNSDPNDKIYNRSVRYGLLDLSRLAPPSVSPYPNPNKQGENYRCRMPVWRLALSTCQVDSHALQEPQSPSVNSMLYNETATYTTNTASEFRPYTCDLGPWPLPELAGPEPTPDPDPNPVWVTQSYSWMANAGKSNPKNYLIDKISANLMHNGQLFKTGSKPNLITLDRFVWFVDRANLDIQPPENVYCYMNGTGGNSGTGTIGKGPGQVTNSTSKLPMRFLLEPGHYAVVGPERLDHYYDQNNFVATRRNFITFTARSDILKSDANNNDKTNPKSISMQPAWYPAWFNLDVELRDPKPANAASGFPGTVKNIPGYGANVPYKTSYAMGDVVNYIRSGASFDQMTYNYPVMASPYEIWTQSLTPLTNNGGTLLPAEIKTPLTIPVAAINNTNQIKDLQPYSGVNISEPVGGYTAQTSTTTPTDVTYRIKDSLDESIHSILQYDLLPTADDLPWDGKVNSSELLGAGQNPMLAPGFYDDVRTVFLQRLANPLVAWHPIYNPYITVDWMPIDLLVYNGESVWQDPSDMMATPTIQNVPTLADLDSSSSGGSSSTSGVKNLMMSRQRGLSAADQRAPGETIDMHSLWPAYAKKISISPYAFDYFNPPAFTSSPQAFRHDPVCSLGYLNHFYKVSTAVKVNQTAALPAVEDRLVLAANGQTVGPLNSVDLAPLATNSPRVPWFVLVDYIGSPPRPFPWVTWFNRPFANQMELMLVPATSPSKFTTEFTYQTTPRRYTAANAGPLNTTPTLPDNAAIDVDFAQPNFFGSIVKIGAGAAQRAEVDKQTSRRWPFGHLLNFFASSRPDDPGDPMNGASTPDSLSRFLARPNFYRMLEYVHVGTRFSGSEDFITPFSPWDPGGTPNDPANVVFSPPFNRLPKFREPGRVNLNTFMGANMSRWELTWDMPANEKDSDMFGVPTSARVRDSLDPSQNISPAQHWGSLVNFTPMHNIHWELFNRSRYAGDLSTWIDINVDKNVPPTASIKLTPSINYVSPWVRSPTRPQLYNPARPSIYANPFRSYTNSLRVPYGVQRERKYPDDVVATNAPGVTLDKRKNPLHRYSDASFLRWDDIGNPKAINGDNGSFLSGSISNPRAEGMFVTDDFLDKFGPTGGSDPTTMNVHHIHDPTRNPYFRYQDYMKLGNVATTHSNVYAVWMTMGMFEVEPVQDKNPGVAGYRHPSVIATTNPDGYRLVRELGSETGDIRRSRSFMVIDRSVPVGFQRGENFNVDKAIKVRRFIE